MTAEEDGKATQQILMWTIFFPMQEWSHIERKGNADPVSKEVMTDCARNQAFCIKG